MKNPYLKKTRISTHQFRKFLKYFAMDFNATQIAELMNWNRNTVNLWINKRVRPYFGTIIRDAEKPKNPVPNVFIASHGTTIRAFVMMWLHLESEWFEKEANPKNASIRHIGRDTNGRWKDFGYIYNGRLGR